MTARVDPFKNLSEIPSFEPKPKRELPVRTDVIEQIADENKFVSRQTPKPLKEPRRKKRVYTTGRHRQFNMKASDATVERFHKLADERDVSLAELLELALDALEKAKPLQTEHGPPGDRFTVRDG
ncbi:MAG TPA: hypothetical protein VKU01_05665 [Bryobacteraceae bacterium]|nr:hypothetical protein [Bryobacteraceae bacterium]